MQEDKEEEYRQYIANIFKSYAREKFGQMLDFLCEKAQLSQRELGRRSTKYRNYLMKKGYLPAEKGTVGQTGISRVINAEKMPSYTQVYVWLHELKEVFESEVYKDKCEALNEPPYMITQDFEDDMWRLASFTPPRIVREAYERHKRIIY